MAALAETVLFCESAGAFVFVVNNDNDAVGAEGRGLPDKRHFALEESVELRVAVVTGTAVRFAIVATVGNGVLGQNARSEGG